MMEKLVDQVYAHAEKELPNECCGLAIVRKGKLKYFPCRNISGTKNQFVINPADYAKAEDLGEIVGVCHSHPYVSEQPSIADKIMCEETQLPWLIVNYPNKTYSINYPEGYKAPLVGREFYYGVTDCYTIVRDYYKELGIELKRYNSKNNWWHNGGNLYEDNFMNEGFVIVGDSSTPPKEHDVLMMKCASDVINHIAVYIGDGMILQHCTNRYSGKDIYGGYWKKATQYVIRHKSML